MPSTITSLPALKPNQPNQRMAAPRTTIGMLCGSIGTLPYPSLLPRTMAPANAENPEEMCTTVPPAKSSANEASSISGLRSSPPPPTNPPPHTQWAIGSYTNVPHRRTKIISALNFILSIRPPMISIGVMIANVPWNAANSECGTVLGQLSPHASSAFICCIWYAFDQMSPSQAVGAPRGA